MKRKTVFKPLPGGEEMKNTMNTKELLESLPNNVQTYIDSLKWQRKNNIINDSLLHNLASGYTHGLCDAGLITDRQRGMLFIYITL